MKYFTSNNLLILLVVAASAAAAGIPEVNESRVAVCAVAIQDRSAKPQATTELDSLLERAMAERHIPVIALSFDPPADVQYAARRRGCTHILYTDLVQTNETPASRTRRLCPFRSSGSVSTISTRVEFRLFHIDEVLPMVSTSVYGKNRRDVGLVYVSSRLVGMETAPEALTMAQLHRLASLGEAFDRQAEVIQRSLGAR